MLRVLAGEAESNAAALVLVHEPDFAGTVAATGRFDLQLSGHSHGGQVDVPGFGPPLLPPLARLYPRGLYRIGGNDETPPLVQHTNPGLGSVAMQVRFNCRPEITVLELRGGSREQVPSHVREQLRKMRDLVVGPGW